MKNEVAVVARLRRFRGAVRDIKSVAYFFLDALEIKNTAVDIYLISDTQMRKLNREYRGENVSTNVLAFEVPKDFPNPDSTYLSIGEIYLSPLYIKKHKEDVSYLLLHGLLHLCGFNHENKSDRIKMEKQEEKLMQWLNHKS